jgi:hypothetical protein
MFMDPVVVYVPRYIQNGSESLVLKVLEVDAFLASPLDGSESLASCPCHFAHGERYLNK